MAKDLYIQVKASEVEIALLEDKKLIEYHVEKENSQFKVGDFYLGKVKKIIPAMNAAFVDVGFEKDGFLHYTDLSPNINSILKFTKEITIQKNANLDIQKFTKEPETLKKGKIDEVLKSKPYILVQILKEPIANKGPRLTCEFALSGRHVVLTPFGNGVNLSKKIRMSDERKRLSSILNSFKLNNFGIIARTAAEGKLVSEIQNDIENMLKEWSAIQKNIIGSVPPMRARSEDSKINTLLRDILNEEFNSIIVNDINIERQLKEYLQKNEPEKLRLLKCFSKDNLIFETFGITKQLKSLFGRTVNLSSGAYLILEKTEALHVIDVNSGNKANSINQEENALNTNIEAATEIARLLRLRDLGGIIVVDFIDMKIPENKKKILDIMDKAMKLDRAKHAILPLSKFNIMQITRQRIKPELDLDVQDTCPACKGNGKITPIINIEDEITKSLDFIMPSIKKSIKIVVHPMVFAYLNQGFIFTIIWQWKWKYKRNITLQKNKNLAFNNYIILDKNNDEIMQK